MIEDLCITSNYFLLLFFLNFGVDEAVDPSLFSSDSSLLRDAKPTRSFSFRLDKLLARLKSGSDGILT